MANSRGPDTLSHLAAKTGATAVSVPEAVHGVDLVIVTIPEKNIPNLPAGLFADTPDQVVVVDTGNYYPRQRDGRIEAIEAGMPESTWVAQQLGRPVIKAFNNIYASRLLESGRPKGAAGRIALPVSGDDQAAKARTRNGRRQRSGKASDAPSSPKVHEIGRKFVWTCEKRQGLAQAERGECL